LAEFVRNEQVREHENFQQLLNDLQADNQKEETMDTLAQRLIHRYTPQVKEINGAKRRREEELGKVLLPDLKYGY